MMNTKKIKRWWYVWPVWEICFEEVLWQTDNSMHIAVHPANNKDDSEDHVDDDYDDQEYDDNMASYTSTQCMKLATLTTTRVMIMMAKNMMVKIMMEKIMMEKIMMMKIILQLYATVFFSITLLAVFWTSCICFGDRVDQHCWNWKQGLITCRRSFRGQNSLSFAVLFINIICGGLGWTLIYSKFVVKVLIVWAIPTQALIF